jgi:hypothetical protein
MTFDDLKEKLKHEDEITVIEILDLSSEELVDILESYIYDQQEKIRNYYCETTEAMGGEEESY